MCKNDKKLELLHYKILEQNHVQNLVRKCVAEVAFTFYFDGSCMSYLPIGERH